MGKLREKIHDLTKGCKFVILQHVIRNGECKSVNSGAGCHEKLQNINVIMSNCSFWLFLFCIDGLG